MGAARIDPATWRPSKGLESNRENVKKVYAYYADLYNQRPELKWAGMAKLAGGTVYDGLEQTELGKTAAKAGAFLIPGKLPREAAQAAYGEAHYLQAELLGMQKKIFEDLAWQHQAYVEGGLPALEAAQKRGEITSNQLGVWRDIASGDENRQWNGNTALLKREQEDILKEGYEHIRTRTTSLDLTGSSVPLGPISIPLIGKVKIESGDMIAIAMSKMAQSPVPDGRPFADVMGPNANITVFKDRWQWIENDMLPAYRNLSLERRTALINQPLEELAGRKFR